MIPLTSLIQAIHDRFFCPQTGLIYDYLTSDNHAQRFQFLPTDAEVMTDLPNPCGWGTGMEDCMINGGLMLDVLTRFPDDAWRNQLIKGMDACATVHGRPGFLARGISPFAPEHTYSNTSRDQITVAVYGLFRHRSEKKAAQLLNDIAQDCLNHMTPQNHYNLRRLDGHPAFCCDMWNCQCHEILRLPMTYAAAYAATQQKHFLHDAEKLMPEAMDKTLTFDNVNSWWDLPTLQMQLSLQLLIESKLFPAYQKRLLDARTYVATLAQKKLPMAIQQAEQWQQDWNPTMTDWRLLPTRFHRDTAGEQTVRSECCGGKTYRVPVKPETFQKPSELLRACGCWLTIVALGQLTVPQQHLHRLEAILRKAEPHRHCSDALVKILEALSLLQERTR